MAKEKAALTKVTKAWSLLAPQGTSVLLLHLCFCPLPGAALYLNLSVLFELVLGVRCPVALPGRSCLSERL